MVETAEAVVKEAEEEHARLQKEYQDMCAGVATEKEGSRTLTDQVRRELNRPDPLQQRKRRSIGSDESCCLGQRSYIAIYTRPQNLRSDLRH